MSNNFDRELENLKREYDNKLLEADKLLQLEKKAHQETRNRLESSQN